MESNEVPRGSRAGRAHDEEYQFLQHREGILEAELEERDALLESEFPETGSLPRGQDEWNRLWRRELALIRELKREIERTELEQKLRRRLRIAQRRLSRFASEVRERGAYSPDYWEIEEERGILTNLLRRWWEWRDGPPVDVSG
jgi:hypothetical protein